MFVIQLNKPVYCENTKNLDNLKNKTFLPIPFAVVPLKGGVLGIGSWMGIGSLIQARRLNSKSCLERLLNGSTPSLTFGSVEENVLQLQKRNMFEFGAL